VFRLTISVARKKLLLLSRTSQGEGGVKGDRVHLLRTLRICSGIVNLPQEGGGSAGLGVLPCPWLLSRRIAGKDRLSGSAGLRLVLLLAGLPYSQITARISF
jgi:hypothetical protein